MIGISTDRRETNQKFARELGIGFPLVSDETGSVSKAYGVLMPLIHWAWRTTFLIDEKGIIRAIQTGGKALDPKNALQVCELPRRGPAI